MFLNPDFQVDEESEVKQSCIAQVWCNIYQDALNVRMFLRPRNWKALRTIMAGAKLPSDYGTIMDNKLRKPRNISPKNSPILSFLNPLSKRGLLHNLSWHTCMKMSVNENSSSYRRVSSTRGFWKLMRPKIYIGDILLLDVSFMGPRFYSVKKGQNNWTLLLNLVS